MSEYVMQLQSAMKQQSQDLRDEMAELKAWQSSITQQSENVKKKHHNQKNEIFGTASGSIPPIRYTSSSSASNGGDSKSTKSGYRSEGEIFLECKDRGNAYFSKMQYDDAKRAYTKGLDTDPTHAQCNVLYANRALCCLKMQQWDDAEKDATSSISLNRTNAKAFFRRALARKQLGDLQGAKADLDTVQVLQPGDSDSGKELLIVNSMIAEKAKTENKSDKNAKSSSPDAKPKRKKLVIEEVDDDDNNNEEDNSPEAEAARKAATEKAARELKEAEEARAAERKAKAQQEEALRQRQRKSHSRVEVVDDEEDEPQPKQQQQSSSAAKPAAAAATAQHQDPARTSTSPSQSSSSSRASPSPAATAPAATASSASSSPSKPAAKPASATATTKTTKAASSSMPRAVSVKVYTKENMPTPQNFSDLERVFREIEKDRELVTALVRNVASSRDAAGVAALFGVNITNEMFSGFVTASLDFENLDHAAVVLQGLAKAKRLDDIVMFQDDSEKQLVKKAIAHCTNLSAGDRAQLEKKLC